MKVRNEYDKCYFCKSYDQYEGCMNWFCSNEEGKRTEFSPDNNKIIEKSERTGLSVADIVALIELEEKYG